MLSYSHWAPIISCIETISSFSDMAPLHTLRSSCIWPPMPNTNPRSTQSVQMYVPALHETQNMAKFRLSSNTSSFDSWMVRIRNCRFTAEMRGGCWNNAPFNVCSTFGRPVGFWMGFEEMRWCDYCLQGMLPRSILLLPPWEEGGTCSPRELDEDSQLGKPVPNRTWTKFEKLRLISGSLFSVIANKR